MKKLAVSNIAWSPEEDEAALDLLRDEGVALIEVAPPRIWKDPSAAKEPEVRAWAQALRDRGLAVSSFQALLFGRPDLLLFGSAEARSACLEYLKAIADLAGWCGAGPLVFGSPKNRARGGRTHAEAFKIAREFFSELGDHCRSRGCAVVLEANPADYGCDFIQTLAEAEDLVGFVGNPGFGLHLDTGGLSLSGEALSAAVVPRLAHVHASQPNLADFASPDAVHRIAARALQAGGYAGVVAIEMRRPERGLEGVREAIRHVRGLYFS